MAVGGREGRQPAAEAVPGKSAGKGGGRGRSAPVGREEPGGGSRASGPGFAWRLAICGREGLVYGEMPGWVRPDDGLIPPPAPPTASP